MLKKASSILVKHFCLFLLMALISAALVLGFAKSVFLRPWFPTVRTAPETYFYFHGLSLLNPTGTFCFITSNSWLDVGYGAELQEFLLRNASIHAIYDNEKKRSFEHADVNTIISIFGAPQTSSFESYDKANLVINNVARFVMFKQSFEEAITLKNLLEIDKATQITRKTAFRVFPITQKELLEDGWEYPETYDPKKDAPLSKGQYAGNKWGGKYLRAPDIFFTILEKGKGKLVKLGDIAEVRRGFTTGVNDFFYLEPTGQKAPKGYIQ